VVEGQNGNGRVMSSDELREHLSAYLDGQLSGDLLAQMEQRLQQDDGLRAELEELRDLVTDLGSFPAVPAPPGFAGRVMAGVEGLPLPVSEELGGLAELENATPDFVAENMNVPWWLKSSIALSLAAALALGFFVVRAPLLENPVSLTESEVVTDAPNPWNLPMGTGGDAMADASAPAADELDALDLLPGESEAGDGSEVPSRARLQKQASVIEKSAPAKSAPAVKSEARAPAAASGKRARKKKKSGLREVSRDREFPAGVFQAPHENGLADVEAAAGAGEVAGSAAESPATPAVAAKPAAAEPAVAPSTQAAEDTDPVAADEAAVAETDGVVALEEQESAPTRDSEPGPEAVGNLQAGAPASSPAAEVEGSEALDESPAEPGDLAGASVRSEGFQGAFRGSPPARGPGRRSGGGTGSRGAPERAAGSQPVRPADSQAASPAVEAEDSVVVVSDERGQENQDAPSIAVKLAIGRLRVSSPGVITTLTSEIRAKGWSVEPLTSLPTSSDGTVAATGKQILQIVVPGGAEQDLATLLGSYGALNTDRALATAPDGKARLRLTVHWGN